MPALSLRAEKAGNVSTLIERWKRVYLTLVDVVFLLGAAGVAVGSTVLVTTAHSVLDEIHCEVCVVKGKKK